jgi:uroporphyrin-III C-methyltransferase/precorrin-2 dehydrogenase/sirohydrochlorin ferrochelatase
MASTQEFDRHGNAIGATDHIPRLHAGGCKKGGDLRQWRGGGGQGAPGRQHIGRDRSVYADAPEAELIDSLGRVGIEPVIAAYAAAQIDGATLVFAATGDATMDRMIVADARERKIPANAVDQPEFCDFLTPALVNRAPVAIAIGTEGAGPVLAQMIRARVDQMLSPSLGALARLAQDYRVAVDRLLPRGVARRVFWRRFFEADVATHVAHNEISLARRAATRMLRGREPVSPDTSGWSVPARVPRTC